MGKKYKLLTLSEMGKMKETLEQVREDPQYETARMLYAYAKENGAIREDVYQYLLENMTFLPSSASILNTLLKIFAGPEWFALVKKMEERLTEGSATKGNLKLFQQMVLDAYRDGVPYAYIAQSFENARYPYELNQKIDLFNSNKGAELTDVINGLKAVVDEFQKDLHVYEETHTKLEECMEQKDKAIRSLKDQLVDLMENGVVPELEFEEEQEDGLPAEKTYTDNEIPEEEILPESEPKNAGNGTGLENDIKGHLLELVERIRQDNDDFKKCVLEMLQGAAPIPQSMSNKHTASVIPEGEDSKFDREELPPNEPEVTAEPEHEKNEDTPQQMEEKHDVVETSKDVSEEVKKVTFFQKVRERKRKSAFEKLPDKKKAELIFEIMHEKNYTGEMIISVRTCLDLGVSYEFIYSFIEMGVREEDLKKLILFRTTEKNGPPKKAEEEKVKEESAEEKDAEPEGTEGNVTHVG